MAVWLRFFASKTVTCGFGYLFFISIAAFSAASYVPNRDFNCRSTATLMANEVEYGEAVAISDNRFPVDQERLGWQGRDCRNNDREATREVIAVARDELLVGP
jgi:hypothetical protein